MDDRAEFEAWAEQAGWPHRSINADGSYFFSSASWEPWQAATQRQQERIAYVEKIAEDAIELCTQQANRVMELEAQVQALSMDAGRYRFLRGQAFYNWVRGGGLALVAPDVDADVDSQVDAAIAAGKGEG